MQVADDGAPRLAATQGFSVVVLRPAAPVLGGPAWTNGRINLLVSGVSGPDYSLYQSPDLSAWSLLFQTNAPSLPFSYLDPAPPTQGQRFYRVQLGP